MDEETKQTFDTVDHCFTVFYVLELLLNLFVNWFWPFVCNGWSMFDALAVLMSVVGALLNTFSSGQSNNYLSIIRSIRMYVALSEPLPHCAPRTSSVVYNWPTDDSRTRIPLMPACACLFARLFLTIDELMLHARDFHACAPARLFCLPLSVSLSLCICLHAQFQDYPYFLPNEETPAHCDGHIVRSISALQHVCHLRSRGVNILRPCAAAVWQPHARRIRDVQPFCFDHVSDVSFL